MATLLFSPGPRPHTVRSADGEVRSVPADWILVPPGDPALTRRIKGAGEHYVVAEKRGRKVFSLGVWGPSCVVEQIRRDLVKERSTEGFAKKQESAARRREKVQTEYVEDFQSAVIRFLDFAPVHAEIAVELARKVTEHATPVGSGTVARTTRIPIERRAEAAVIAWMRHQTTGYDHLKIPRIKGKRREVRRELAQRSKVLLARYRHGDAALPDCPLSRALRKNPLSSDSCGDEN